MMEWTTNKPNRTGFYWFEAEDCGAEVCLVSTLGDGVSAYFVNGKRIELWELTRGRWSSEPIPEPKVPA